MAKTKRVKRQLRKKSTFRKKGKGKDHEIAFLLKQKLSNVAKTFYDNDNAIVGNIVSRLPRDQIDKDAYERRLNKALAHNIALLAEQEAKIKDFNASRKDGPSRGTRNRTGPRTHPELKKLYLERDHTKEAISLNQHELRQLQKLTIPNCLNQIRNGTKKECILKRETKVERLIIHNNYFLFCYS